MLFFKRNDVPYDRFSKLMYKEVIPGGDAKRMRRYRPTKSKHIGDYVLNGRNTKDIGDYEAILKKNAVTVS